MPKSKSKPKPKSNSYKIIVGALSVVCSVVFTVFIVHLFVGAGELNPSEAPGDTMKTLDDIYCAMTIDTTATSYDEDSPGVAASTMYTLQEIYDKAVKFPLSHTGQTTSYDTGTADDPHYTASSSFTCDMDYNTSAASTVIDNCTGLMWQKCSRGLDAEDCSGTATTVNWQGAIDYCEGLGLASKWDWRLPNAKELWSITLLEAEAVDGKKASDAPYINQTVFPSTFSGIYWSSTTNPYNTATALVVYFDYAGVSSYSVTSSTYVRCVRGQ